MHCLINACEESEQRVTTLAPELYRNFTPEEPTTFSRSTHP
jgi:hypothetical protein